MERVSNLVELLDGAPNGLAVKTLMGSEPPDPDESIRKLRLCTTSHAPSVTVTIVCTTGRNARTLP